MTLALTRRGLLRLGAVGTAGLAVRPAVAGSFSVLRTPYLQDLNPSEVTIAWMLDAKGTGQVSVTDPTGAIRTFPAVVTEVPRATTGLDTSCYLYQARITNLTPGLRYSYSPTCDWLTLGSPRQSFKTPSAEVSFSFLHVADAGTGWTAQHRIAEQMSQEKVSLVLANGDLAYDIGNFQAVQSHFHDIYGDMMGSVPFYTSLGNHEYMTDAAAPSLVGRTAPASGVPPIDQGRYYSFDWGNVHFVCLDTNTPLYRVTWGDDSMLKWLERDLSNTRKFWRIAFFHHPGYATGTHQFEPEAELVRTHIVPILERYGVQLVLNGHEHNFQRTHPLSAGKRAGQLSPATVYVTAGGGGQSTYVSQRNDAISQVLGVNHYLRTQVSGSKLTVTAIDINGSTIDTLDIAPTPFLAQAAIEPASSSQRIASGGLVSLYGSNLCLTSTQPTPSTLDANGTTVFAGDTPIPVLYADANQINLHLPFNLAGKTRLTVRTANGTVSSDLDVAPVAPSIFLDAGGAAIAERADGSVISDNSPLRPGETVSLLMTGLGSVAGPAVAGRAPAAPLPVSASVNVSVSGQPATLISATLDSGYPGLYRVVFQVPASIQSSAMVQVTAAGAASNTAKLPIAN